MATQILNSHRAREQEEEGEMEWDRWDRSWPPPSAAPTPLPSRELESVSVCRSRGRPSSPLLPPLLPAAAAAARTTA